MRPTLSIQPGGTYYFSQSRFRKGWQLDNGCHSLSCTEHIAGEPLSSIRILVVDDYEDWRTQVRSLLQARKEWQVVSEVSDGIVAVQKATELRPDVILLDIGLPNLDGIEAARRIRQVCPDSKIIFLSADNSADVVQAALSTGAHGFVHKARATIELLPAIETVLRAAQFVSDTSKQTDSLKPSTDKQ
jgi:DNA-binding NarL/FixJ family response regulator